MVQHGTARPTTDDNIIRRMREATDTHSEYVILIAFARQHWLCERASLRYTYIVWLVIVALVFVVMWELWWETWAMLRYTYIVWLLIVGVFYCCIGVCCDLGTVVGDLGDVIHTLSGFLLLESSIVALVFVVIWELRLETWAMLYIHCLACYCWSLLLLQWCLL